MQLRDSKPSMFWPGHWGCFGGGVDKGEDPRQTLARELREELEIDPAAATEFTRITFDLRPVGHPVSSRLFFIVPISAQALSRCVLHEGEAVEAIGADELLTRRRVTPYDCFAIWMHYSRARLLAGAA
jgi:8-oxo-dGTP pyrophosphatase MutT (NUDIX family)